MGLLKDSLIEYSQQVIDGEIIACKKHKWACMRFLKDIGRENTKDFPYVFDEEAAMHFLEWMTLFKHSKGELEGEYIDPAPIQIFIFGNVYGWYRVYEDGRRKRRFTRVYWQVGRKNAKSQSLACVASYEAMAFGVNASEVYLAATKKDQADIVYKEIKLQLKNCDFLEGKYKESYGKIVHDKSDSFIMPLSKDAGKSGDGFNPQCGIIDEYHASKTSEIYDVITSGQSARKNPITIIITTAGFELSHPCYRVEYDLVSKLLDPDRPEDRPNYFAMVNELDPDDLITDEKVWLKANPILASYEGGLEKIREEFELAQLAPEKMRNFLTKYMNKWVQMSENGYMEMDKWKRTFIANPEMPDLQRRHCYVGVDLSQKHDLSSAGFVFPLLDNFFAVKQHSFMPEERLTERMNADGVPYDLWIEQGYLTLTEGDTIDYRYIMNYIKEQIMIHNYIVKELCYDPWSAEQFAQEMEYDRFTPVEIIQGMKTLSEPTKDFRLKVFEKKIIHGNDPLLTWAVGNAVQKADANSNIQLDKAKSTNKIDPIAAVINAYVRASADHLILDMSSHFTKGWKM